MKRVMILSKEDFILENAQDHSLMTLKPHIKKEEANFDLVAYSEGERLIIFKNRFGSIDSVPLNAEMAILLSQE